MKVYILRYELANSEGNHSKCFDSYWNAFCWAEKARNELECVSIHQLFDMSSLLGIIQEKLMMYRLYDEDGHILHAKYSTQHYSRRVE